MKKNVLSFPAVLSARTSSDHSAHGASDSDVGQVGSLLCAGERPASASGVLVQGLPAPLYKL